MKKARLLGTEGGGGMGFSGSAMLYVPPEGMQSLGFYLKQKLGEKSTGLVKELTAYLLIYSNQ